MERAASDVFKRLSIHAAPLSHGAEGRYSARSAGFSESAESAIQRFPSIVFGAAFARLESINRIG
jgi:hypothetical protein